MDRRQFCKIATLSLGALGLSRLESVAAVEKISLPALARDCRIEILRKECFIDLQALHLDDPESGSCPRFKAGSIYRFSSGQKCPDGFCPALWNTVANALSFVNGCPDNMPLEKGRLIISCPDGTRPLIVALDF